MSQFPVISPVSNIHPDDTNPDDKPFTTDTDEDGIPDVHEIIFEDWVNFSAVDGRLVAMKGLDKNDASDANVDTDRDGLNNTEEYCWPYPDNCNAPGFSRGLTGSIDENGDRVYLDPRVADSDGDGMPDGFEVWMCARAGGFDEVAQRYVCPYFDPLNASDLNDDPDQDGLDVNRDGFLSVAEQYTSPEEYQYGMPGNFTTELDGLWCYATLPQGSVLTQWPFISNGLNASFQNLLSACTTNVTGVVGEDLWLGTDPLLDDSDRYSWDGFAVRPLYPSFGDGMPDGWEVHFGLNPLNRSNALLDNDMDGWDVNRDGIVSADVSRTDSALALGEALSNLEEFYIHNDEGNTVRSGLREVELGVNDSSFKEYPLTFNAIPGHLSIMHHDVRSILVDDSMAYYLTRYGMTTIDYETETTQDQWFPQGIIGHEAVFVTSETGPHSIAIATSHGVHVAALQVDGFIEPLESWSSTEAVEVFAIHQLAIEGSNQQLIALGANGEGMVFEVNTGGQITQTFDLGVNFKSTLMEDNVVVTELEHGSVPGGGMVLYVGTQRGMMTLESATGRDDASPSWRFFFDANPSNIPNKIDDLRTLNLGATGNPAEVQALKLDGPNEQNPTFLWIGTPSGLHRLNLELNDMSFGGLLEHPGNDADELAKSNNIHSIFPTGDEILVGSSAGLWVLAGNYLDVYGLQSNSEMPGEIAALATIERNGETYILGASAPGRFANLELMDPGANDSDSDGMPDGWELAYDLDPTDPWDALLDGDVDGLRLNGGEELDRWWTNLEEYRYVARTAEGYNSTLPNQSDSDMDGLLDGSEFFGYFLGETNFDCYYTPQLVYTCDETLGEQARTTYSNLNSIDVGTDPTVLDTDGDGMPDGWEIQHRRWVGSSFNGGNNWSLDPTRAEDAAWDADQDGLANLCEYQWSLVYEAGLQGDLFEEFGESPESVATWSIPDPNLVDSDGDTLPDGWEADSQCTWSPLRVGVNPLNGSDMFENPDGDGYDVNKDGVLTPNEMFVNYLEYHVRSGLFLNNQTLDGVELPNGFTTDLFDNISDFGTPEDDFASRASGAILAGQISIEKGSTDPFSADSDDDGMPDGWEIWFARWNVIDDEWTLNPLQPSDRWLDADNDGMTNWEEYNLIDSELSETNANRSSPQWFVTTLGSAYAFQQWPSASTTFSFGTYMTAEQYNLTGPTGDPNNVDTDGDGIIDGMELLFTAWNLSAQTWTLNPVVAGDGTFDSDNDGLADLQEFALATANPENGIDAPADAPLLHEDGDVQQPTKKAQRVFQILISKDSRGKRLLDDFNAWQSGEPPNVFISLLLGMTDPTNPDTDDDGMYDGFEYWFTSWDLNENRWGLNPLIETDVNLDSDGDSYDCNHDGTIDLDERYSNLREWESRTWGKYLNRSSVPASVGIVDFGEDAMNAYMEETGMTMLQARQALIDDFKAKGSDSVSRMNTINSYNENNFNRTLVGVSDPTHPDSDSDGIPDGWEYCYALYGMDNPSTVNHWAANPLNPWDVDYDGDSDGWYGRTAFDLPAVQGEWDDRVFTPSNQVIQPGIGDLPFTNWMEYDNDTRPDSNDSDSDSESYITETMNGMVTAHYKDFNLTDGREVFKYGTNPIDNDTDGDMIPDWYEYAKAWNESNDNYSSFLKIQVNWIDPATGGACDTSTNSCLPLSLNAGTLERPELSFTWFTMDPRDAIDANDDADQDGNWDCSGVGCVYEPYTNFQEYFAITNEQLSSPNAVRLSGLTFQGEVIQEGWQLRALLLGIGQWDESVKNYLKMDKSQSTDFRYAYLVNDNDIEFLVQDTSNHVVLCGGNLTDPWEIYYTGAPNTAPVRAVGEHEFGWYLLDYNDDHVAEGTDPTNWDTDGDWMVDWFEVNDDEQDGSRGETSPIRYDSRQTT
ncbi:MAG: hypothetical protein CMA97_06310 [Euryarchaeota archaeon]|nr:hypothetical protein [Euryarchaeota archaeon]